jgi:RNA 3'-terminal phosphate cyclase (ATP)
MAEFIEMDGSFGEGGGQILRSSLTLSLLTGKPFHLRNIRARRPKPGLQPQHLMSVRAAAAVGNANLLGASRDSCELTFEPGDVVGGTYRFDIGTAGSTGLVLQTIFLPLALRGRSPSDLVITGGTHVKSSPCYHFLATTWAAYMRLFGLHLDLSMSRPGFYPRGGGEIRSHIEPARQARAAEITEAGQISRISGFAAVAGLDRSIAERMIRRAAQRLVNAGLEADLTLEQWPGGPGTGIGLISPDSPAPSFFFGLGERGKRAERVADEAVDELLAHVTGAAPVDPHSADQILLPLALAEGPSTYNTSRVTQHLRTNIEVVRQFVPRDVRCEGDEGDAGQVTIR